MRLNHVSLSVTELIELPKTTFTSLMAELGGTIRVFLGFNVISFAEIVELGLRAELCLKWISNCCLYFIENSNLIQ